MNQEPVLKPTSLDLLAAFQLGKYCNEICWHGSVACLTHDPRATSLVTNQLGQLSVGVRAVLPVKLREGWSQRCLEAASDFAGPLAWELFAETRYTVADTLTHEATSFESLVEMRRSLCGELLVFLWPIQYLVRDLLQELDPARHLAVSLGQTVDAVHRPVCDVVEHVLDPQAARACLAACRAQPTPGPLVEWQLVANKVPVSVVGVVPRLWVDLIEVKMGELYRMLFQREPPHSIADSSWVHQGAEHAFKQANRAVGAELRRWQARLGKALNKDLVLTDNADGPDDMVAAADVLTRHLSIPRATFYRHVAAGRLGPVSFRNNKKMLVLRAVRQYAQERGLPMIEPG